MSITVHLPRETEEKLRRRAAESGVAADALARHLLEQALNGGGATPATRPATALEEAVAPLRQEVEEAGLTDDQLRQFFTEVRDQARARSAAACRSHS